MPSNARKTTAANARTPRTERSKSTDATIVTQDDPPAIDSAPVDQNHDAIPDATEEATTGAAETIPTADIETPPTDAAPEHDSTTSADDLSATADNDATDIDGAGSVASDGGAGAAIGHDDASSGRDDDRATAPVGRPLRSPDRKVLMIAGILGDLPGGATIAEIADGCGLGPTTVDRLLLAMAYQGAAMRVEADPVAGAPELWYTGTTRATLVDPTNVPTPPAPQPCTACGCPGHARAGAGRPRSAGSIRRASAPGVNGDGSASFTKGELRAHVLAFVNEHPGHVLSASTIAKELGARLSRIISSGAVGNNLDTLAATGHIALHSESPRQFSANTADPDSRASGTA